MTVTLNDGQRNLLGQAVIAPGSIDLVGKLAIKNGRALADHGLAVIYTTGRYIRIRATDFGRAVMRSPEAKRKRQRLTFDPESIQWPE